MTGATDWMPGATDWMTVRAGKEYVPAVEKTGLTDKSRGRINRLTDRNPVMTEGINEVTSRLIGRRSAQIVVRNARNTEANFLISTQTSLKMLPWPRR